MWDYKVVTIEEAGAPDGGNYGRWYRYVIANHVSTITGCRSGSKKDVMTYAKNCVERLNTQQRGSFQRTSIKFA